MRQCHYSVPARLAGWTVNVRLGATVVEVRSGGRVVACHERAVARGAQSLVLDHYLEVLVRTPGALPNATALAQAREQGAFTPTHEAFWRAARRKLGDAPGTRALIEVLLGHRHLPAVAVIEGIRRALQAGSVNPEVVLVEARQAADTDTAQVAPIGVGAQPWPATTGPHRRWAAMTSCSPTTTPARRDTATMRWSARWLHRRRWAREADDRTGR